MVMGFGNLPLAMETYPCVEIKRRLAPVLPEVQRLPPFVVDGQLRSCRQDRAIRGRSRESSLQTTTTSPSPPPSPPGGMGNEADDCLATRAAVHRFPEEGAQPRGRALVQTALVPVKNQRARPAVALRINPDVPRPVRSNEPGFETGFPVRGLLPGPGHDGAETYSRGEQPWT